jgi:hypothetical protein
MLSIVSSSEINILGLGLGLGMRMGIEIGMEWNGE